MILLLMSEWDLRQTQTEKHQQKQLKSLIGVILESLVCFAK